MTPANTFLPVICILLGRAPRLADDYITTIFREVKHHHDGFPFGENRNVSSILQVWFHHPCLMVYMMFHSHAWRGITWFFTKHLMAIPAFDRSSAAARHDARRKPMEKRQLHRAWVSLGFRIPWEFLMEISSEYSWGYHGNIVWILDGIKWDFNFQWSAEWFNMVWGKTYRKPCFFFNPTLHRGCTRFPANCPIIKFSSVRSRGILASKRTEHIRWDSKMDPWNCFLFST